MENNNDIMAMSLSISAGYTNDELERYIKKLLDFNYKNKTGEQRRVILLSTTNKFKYNEYLKDFEKYGVEVVVISLQI